MNITINLEVPRWFRRVLVPVIGVAVLGATALVWAVPNTFVAGHQLKATELNANFDALEAQLANGCALPVGSLVSSVLTEAQFQTKCGTGWIVADGRSIAGSTLAPLLPTSYAPDARGRFLRGKNNGITSDLGNPDGEVLPGTFQGDAFKQHTHRLRWSAGYNLSLDQGNADNFAGPNTYSTNVTLGSDDGGAETRPRNITVNIFVRVQ